MILSSFHRLHRLLRGSKTALSACAATALLTGALSAKPVPANLGNGLDKLVTSHLALAQAAKSGAALRGTVTVNGKAYTNANVAAIAQSSLSEAATGRLLVRVTLNGSVKLDDVLKAAAGVPSFTATAIDTSYKGVGVFNAYVDVADAAALANTKGVQAVFLEWKPRHNGPAVATTALKGGDTAGPIGPAQQPAPKPEAQSDIGTSVVAGQTLNKLGTAFDQGVFLHRVDQINKGYNPNATSDIEGQGMKIGMISNSYASNTTNTPAIDVANGDLPGAANPYNTQEVYILQDDVQDGTVDDEGRAMTQIAYKMAPKAALAFATADGGEVGFANNIRLLGGLTVNGPNGPVTGTFGADVVCDDVGYFDEPFFQDGIIGNGVDDVAAAGVVYCSSAANDIGTNGYDSDTRWVANGTGLTGTAGNTALTGTNINLANVPTNLYAGGFHNFNPGGQDVAQTVNIGAANTVPTIFQWNDVYDQNTATTGNTPVFSGSGTYTNAAVNFTVPATVTAGTKYQFVEAATNNSGFDGIVTVYKSDGTTVLAGPQDTGTDETIRLTAPANDTGFVVKVDHFGTTAGTFSLNVNSYSGFTTPGVTTNLSVLVFDTAGNYLAASSLTTDTTTTNTPVQLGYTNPATGATQVQYVIARSVVPAQGNAYPTHVRYLLPGNGRGGYGPAEYFTYNTVTTGGHAMAQGCNGAAAYNSFRPNLPATFTSPGPVTIYYDKNDNRLATPQIRLQPRVAADNAANVSSNMSYFTGDSGSDPDGNPNFSGTSAASPHLAAIAALVLQGHGGRRSLTPTQVTSILQRSTFQHDLDPNFSSGSARVNVTTNGTTTSTGKITINISSDASTANATGLTNTGGNDPFSFAINYVGSSPVTSIVFNPGGTANTGGNVTGGNNGVTYSTASNTAVGGTVTYFENSLPGVAFLPSTKAFTQPASPAVPATATFTNLSSGTNQFYTMTVTPTGTGFTGGKVLNFTVGRGVARSSATGAGITTVTNSTAGAALYTADIFGGGVFLPSGAVVTQGMTFNGTTADGGVFGGVITNRIGTGWATQDGYGFVNAEKAVTLPAQ